MPYKHYGEIGDIWKHLPLCEVIAIESPKNYIETNAAYAEYRLDKTEERDFGIFNIIEKADSFSYLKETVYYQLISPYVNKNKYIGSSGLAISILRNKADKFLFFDLENEALDNIKSFAEQNTIADKVEVINKDSISGLLQMLPSLSASTLIHIDPYYIDEPNNENKSFLDLFVRASVLGLKCFLWYGFETLNDKDYLNGIVRKSVDQFNITNAYCCELMLEEIQSDVVICNPGVVGCGVLTSNLSPDSNNAISNLADLIVTIYKDSHYKECKGDLRKEVVINLARIH